jgi:hypothetical protein
MFTRRKIYHVHNEYAANKRSHVLSVAQSCDDSTYSSAKSNVNIQTHAGASGALDTHSNREPEILIQELVSTKNNNHKV